MKIQCPKCGQNYEVEEGIRGEKVECQICKTEFIATGAQPDLKPIPSISPNANLIYCPDCGKQISRNATACPNCGSQIQRQQATPAAAPMNIIVNNSANATAINNGAISTKSRLMYILLALFLGMAGIHNFYAGYTGTGIIQLILLCCGVGVFINPVWIIFDILFTTKDGRGIPFK